MPAGLARLFRLFLASYAPLALILAVQRSKGVWPPWDRPAFWVFAVIGVIGLVDAYRLPRGALRKGHIRVTLSDLTDEGGQVAAYIATYLLPFIGFALVGWRDVVALTIYFAVLFVVFARSDLALVNPALYLTGWRAISAKRDELPTGRYTKNPPRLVGEPFALCGRHRKRRRDGYRRAR